MSRAKRYLGACAEVVHYLCYENFVNANTSITTDEFIDYINKIAKIPRITGGAGYGRDFDIGEFLANNFGYDYRYYMALFILYTKNKENIDLTISWQNLDIDAINPNVYFLLDEIFKVIDMETFMQKIKNNSNYKQVFILLDKVAKIKKLSKEELEKYSSEYLEAYRKNNNTTYEQMLYEFSDKPLSQTEILLFQIDFLLSKVNLNKIDNYGVISNQSLRWVFKYNLIELLITHITHDKIAEIKELQFHIRDKFLELASQEYPDEVELSADALSLYLASKDAPKIQELMETGKLYSEEQLAALKTNGYFSEDDLGRVKDFLVDAVDATFYASNNDTILPIIYSPKIKMLSENFVRTRIYHALNAGRRATNSTESLENSKYEEYIDYLQANNIIVYSKDYGSNTVYRITDYESLKTGPKPVKVSFKADKRVLKRGYLI